jgi:hypothetical protein
LGGGFNLCVPDFRADSEVRVVEVFDSTALAKVTYKKYPWMDLELGDEVELK